MDICPCCGDEASFEVAEVFLDTREILLDACCEQNLCGWMETIAAWPRKLRSQWMLSATGIHVRDIVTTGEVLSWTLDYGVHLEEVTFADAKEFIREHHRHCRPPKGWKFGAAVFNGTERVGVATVGRPVSRVLQKQGCIEVNRVCVKQCAPRALGKDACSMLYGQVCREAFERGYGRVVTYTLIGEAGTSLRAAGFRPVARTRGGPWNRSGRPRTDNAPTIPKIRWERWQDSDAVPMQLSLPLAA